jgi:hypothetical protein
MTRTIRILLAACAAMLPLAGPGVAEAQTITITGCTSLSSSGGTNSSSIQITCNTSASQPGAPVCSNANITAVGSPATSLTFTATCTQGTSAITSILGTSTNNDNATLPGPFNSPYLVNIPGIPVPPVTATYTITASDGTLSASASATYQVGTVTGSLDMKSCAAQGLTGHLYDLAYSTTGNVNATTANVLPAGGFGKNDVIVVRFTTPATVGDTSNLQLNPTAGYSQTNKIATLSAGAFSCLIAPSTALTGGVIATTKGLFPNLKFQIAGSPSFGGPIILQPNTTYYVTYVNRDTYGSSVSNCPGNDCKQDIHFQN